MTHLRFAFVTLFLLLNLGIAKADTDFDRGLQELQAGQPTEALSAFEQHLLQYPQDTSALTNAGLAAVQAGKLGQGIAYFRHAITLGDSSTANRQGLEFAFAKITTKDLPRELSLWEVAREQWLWGISMDLPLVAFAISLLLFGLLMLRYFSQRNRALLYEEALPQLRLAHALSAILLLLTLVVLLAKLADLGQSRGTLIAAKTEVRSAPDGDAPVLFDLYEAFEVLVRKQQGDWLQVTYPGGSTGWISAKDVYITQSGKLMDF